jgi:secreted Zn-dependent insulinase-like peptidase
VCAVESEFVGVSQDDDCRMGAVLSATARAQHPLSTFMWGNKKSLWTEPLEQGLPIRERILQHWKSFYSASCMNLVVMGGESLDDLQGYITEEFGAVCATPTPSVCLLRLTALHACSVEGTQRRSCADTAVFQTGCD